MSEQDWGLVFGGFAILVALIALWISIVTNPDRRERRRIEKAYAPPPPTFTDRPRCAVHGGPVDGDVAPVEVHMQVELFGTGPLPVTLFICQDCASMQAYGKATDGR